MKRDPKISTPWENRKPHLPQSSPTLSLSLSIANLLSLDQPIVCINTSPLRSPRVLSLSLSFSLCSQTKKGKKTKKKKEIEQEEEKGVKNELQWV